MIDEKNFFEWHLDSSIHLRQRNRGSSPPQVFNRGAFSFYQCGEFIFAEFNG
ncbi:hypothetical protein ACFL27_04205 [candidate division CSSED10-310 bacterium]|uniref:Uncharacterized protein n=1 Tax=candidate division CSSED10-310 bacterium TaxID=2855610 RepID=A0ABV6YT93_UNCC1